MAPCTHRDPPDSTAASKGLCGSPAGPRPSACGRRPARRRVGLATVCLAALALSSCAGLPFPHLRVYPLPAHVTFAGEAIPVNRPSVEVRISDWYNYYLTTPWLIATWLERSRQIFPIIDRTLKADGLPKDLRYVAVAESDLAPRAYSSAAAAGIWQFIPATAKSYGLTINTYVDQRYDYIAATKAAARYFRQAHAQIGGSWLLAVAAYNLGVTGVVQRVDRQKSVNFWNMVFPYQTSNYVPRIIAIKLVMQNAARLGIRARVRLPTLFPIVLRTPSKPIFVTDIARFLGMSFREVWMDNPQIWEPYLVPGRYRFYLPVADKARAARLGAYLNALPYQKVYYASPGGMTVAQTATTLDITSDELATFNNLQPGAVLKKGQKVYYWRLG